jgi:hypothetical protein
MSKDNKPTSEGQSSRKTLNDKSQGKLLRNIQMKIPKEILNGNPGENS